MGSSMRGNFITYITLALIGEFVSLEMPLHRGTSLSADKICLHENLLPMHSPILTILRSYGQQRCQFHMQL